MQRLSTIKLHKQFSRWKSIQISARIGIDVWHHQINIILIKMIYRDAFRDNSPDHCMIILYSGLFMWRIWIAVKNIRTLSFSTKFDSNRIRKFWAVVGKNNLEYCIVYISWKNAVQPVSHHTSFFQECI